MLGSIKRDEHDDGTVVGHRSLADLHEPAASSASTDRTDRPE
jgi:hypothetical protein